MANITSNTSGPKPWYEEFSEPEYGMVSGMSNALFFGIIVGGLLVLAGVAALLYHCKRKNGLKKELAEQQNQPKTVDGNQVAPTSDIYEDMEGEIKKHEQQKAKLQKYLSFLLNKDPQGLAAVQQKRLAAARARQNNNWF